MGHRRRPLRPLYRSRPRYVITLEDGTVLPATLKDRLIHAGPQRVRAVPTVTTPRGKVTILDPTVPNPAHPKRPWTYRRRGMLHQLAHPFGCMVEVEFESPMTRVGEWHYP